jgi:hypothetical protein
MQSFARSATLARALTRTAGRSTSAFHSSACALEYYNNVSAEVSIGRCLQIIMTTPLNLTVRTSLLSSSQTFKKQVLEAKGPVVVDFYAT